MASHHIQGHHQKQFIKDYGKDPTFWETVVAAIESELPFPPKSLVNIIERVCSEVKYGDQNLEEDSISISSDLEVALGIHETLCKAIVSQPEAEPEPDWVIESASDDEIVRAARQFAWLQTYIDYCASVSDAPLRYHVLTGLGLLAAAAGNQFRLFIWGIETFPCLYTLLIGDSGSRKSSCLRRAKSMLQDACPDRIAPDTFSEEGLINFLSLNASCLMTLDELAYILKTGKKDAYRGLRELLTSLYGETFTRRQLSKKHYEIDRPALSIMTATNTDLLLECLTEQDIFGGFLARFLVSINPPLHKGERTDPLLLGHVKSSLVKSLQAIANYHTTTLSTADIEITVETWRAQFVESLSSFPRELMPFLPRLDALVYRVALLLRLADGIPAGGSALGEMEVEAACLIVGQLTLELLVFLREELVGEEAEKILRRLVYWLALQGGRVTRTDFLRHAHMKAKVFDSFMETLIEREELKTSSADDRQYYELSADGWKLAERKLGAK